MTGDGVVDKYQGLRDKYRLDRDREQAVEYNRMVDIINQLAPYLFSAIGSSNQHMQYKKVFSDNKEENCWLLSYEQRLGQDEPSFYELLTAEGKIVTALVRLDTDVFERNDVLSPLRHCRYSDSLSCFRLVMIFDGLMEVGRFNEVSEMILFQMRIEFYLCYAKYCRAEALYAEKIRV